VWGCAIAVWGCVGCDSEALLQAVRCFEGVGDAIAVRDVGKCDSEARPRNRY